MKNCPNCNAENEDNFEVCWSCQYSFQDGKILTDNDFKETCSNCNCEIDSGYDFCPNCLHDLNFNNKTRIRDDINGDRTINCLRCNVPMFFKGNSKFHEGARIGALGGLFELLTNRESFDVYFCAKCGKVEFFIPLEVKED